MRFEFELLGMRLTFAPVDDEEAEEEETVRTIEQRTGIAGSDFGFSPDPAFIDKYPE